MQEFNQMILFYLFLFDREMPALPGISDWINLDVTFVDVNPYYFYVLDKKL
jgi:hypothetical protein